MSGIVEIRDYTIEAKWFEQYVEWAKVAAPWLLEAITDNLCN